jgi:hypothetical protein
MKRSVTPNISGSAHTVRRTLAPCWCIVRRTLEKALGRAK